ncbi:hypothetical protein SARC_08475, partial [Sphaeroforma arctica JP610]
MVFENEDGDLLIYDWKRCKDVTPTPAFKKFSGMAGLEHVLDCKFYHYSLQLNIYKYMVERAYGKKVVELAPVVLYPDQNTYQFSPVADMMDEVRTLMMHRHIENWVRDDHGAADNDDAVTTNANTTTRTVSSASQDPTDTCSPRTFVQSRTMATYTWTSAGVIFPQLSCAFCTIRCTVASETLPNRVSWRRTSSFSHSASGTL